MVGRTRRLNLSTAKLIIKQQTCDEHDICAACADFFLKNVENTDNVYFSFLKQGSDKFLDIYILNYFIWIKYII